MDEKDVSRYSTAQIDTLLSGYEGLVQELPDLAAAWDKMDAMERSHHLAMFGQTWGDRHLLGALFKAGRLAQAQEERLAQLDQLLLERSRLARQCYGLDSRRLMRLFLWGTPLSLSHQAVRLELDPATLREMVLAWAGM